jgi:hypothetical protein
MAVNKGRKFHITDAERERIREVKRTNTKIKALKESLDKIPNIETMAELFETEEYLKSIKKVRMKRYERVKAKRNQSEVGHT